MQKRIGFFFENPMNLMLPIAVVPEKVDVVCVSQGWVLISIALAIIHLVLISFLLH